MSYPTWRVESWYDANKFLGFRVAKGAGPTWTLAPDGIFPVESGDAFSKTTMRNAAIRLRDSLTAQETDPQILAAECRAILRDTLKISSGLKDRPTEVSVPSIPLTIWLKDRIDRLCMVLDVGKDTG